MSDAEGARGNFLLIKGGDSPSSKKGKGFLANPLPLHHIRRGSADFEARVREGEKEREVALVTG